MAIRTQSRLCDYAERGSNINGLYDYVEPGQWAIDILFFFLSFLRDYRRRVGEDVYILWSM